LKPHAYILPGVFGAALFLFAGCETAPVPPQKLSEATLRSYVLGHWYQEVFGDVKNRFEIEYHPDGSVTGFQWHKGFYPEGTTKDWCTQYTGTWTLAGQTLTHSWTARGQYYHTVPDPGECGILELTRSDMNLQDKMTDHILTFHRKLRVASTDTPNQTMERTPDR
jgi:hypothetical protein